MRVQHEPILQENANGKIRWIAATAKMAHTAAAADGDKKNQYPALGGHWRKKGEKLILCFTALLGYVKYCGYYGCVSFTMKNDILQEEGNQHIY